MNRTNVLVVVIDGLRASALGAYGNTTFATPALDHFAAESFLLDFCFAPAAELSDNYRALWQAIHPLRPTMAEGNALSLSKYFADSGYTTTLITDDVRLSSFAAVEEFHHRVEVATAPEEEHELRAEDAAQTAMARLFAAAYEQIGLPPHPVADMGEPTPPDTPRLVWVHSRGMYGPWDAPIDLQQSLLDEGDPPPVESTTPPDLALTDADDPDTAFRYSCAYAAQVIVFDACWQELMVMLTARPAQESWLVVLLGARGFPLGEHQRVGGVDHRLYVEQLHMPFLMRFPDSQGKLARSGALTSHVDLLPTLRAWIHSDDTVPKQLHDGMSLLPLVSDANAAWRDALLSASDTSKSIRTATWSLRHDQATAQGGDTSSDPIVAGELYVRPDDRWEANDVAKLCPDVVESLDSAVAQALQQLNANEPLGTTILSEESNCA